MVETLAGVAYKVDFASVGSELAPFLGGIGSYHTRVDDGVCHQETFLPANGVLRFQPYGGDWSVRIGAFNCDPVPRAAIFGPSSTVGIATITTGHMVQTALLPRGWARLMPVSPHALANRADAFDQFCPLLSSALSQDLADAADFQEEARRFQARLGDALFSAKPEPALVAEIQELLLDPTMWRVEDAVRQLGIPQWTFARLAKHYFGFAPKLLMRRARFMRTILQIRENRVNSWADIVDDDYTDQSHFIRDCHDFLGMTPGQFAARYQPIGRAAFDAREANAGNRHHLAPPAAPE